jgi:hypothetical protein
MIFGNRDDQGIRLERVMTEDGRREAEFTVKQQKHY